MVSVDNIRISFNGNTLFDKVTFQIKAGQRAGLIGKNGAGKSTLLKALSGLVDIDHGQIILGKNESLGYLKQDLALQGDLSVRKEAEKAFEESLRAKQKLEDLSEELTVRTDYESDAYQELIQEVSDLGMQLELLDESSQEGKIERILMGLGFKREELDKNIQEFSGGWRMRVELAKILLQEPAVLLLDEPTNHLDIVSIQWLEKYLKNYSGIIVLISHDQEFLDQVTNRTIEIVNKGIMDFHVPYSKYLEQKEIHFEQLRASKVNQDKKLEEMERFIERFRAKASKSNQVQSRVKALEKIERIVVEEHEVAAMKIRFPEPPRGSKQVASVINVNKTYGEKIVLDKVNLIIGRNEKLAFVGKNGMGKSTLLKIIVDEVKTTSGISELGQNTSLGYYAQNQAEELDLNKTVFSTIDDIAKGPVRLKIRDLLGSFLFKGEDIDKKVSVLSGGEKARLALCKLLLEPYNLLVLDEPTNHLDILSKQILKDALVNYSGTMIVVSHDRAFLRGLTDKIIEFGERNVKEFAGDIDFFLQQKNLDEMSELDLQKKSSKKGNKDKKDKKSKKPTQDRQQQQEERKVKNKIASLEVEIELLEKKKSDLEVKISDPKNSNDFKLFEEYSKAESELNEVTSKWEKLVD
ncbi:MAG: ATP-binding cassette subfamily F protein 3 [Saprospiraceae bacterium]|jgi:ATP-binding cassette subfamily F protein 3